MHVRKSNERGRTILPWLFGQHTFSFGEYRDLRYMGFGPLRVINEDIIAPAEGFHPHPHEHMEILTFIIEGELMHQDSLGNGSVIKPFEIQRMSAGTGIIHSEMNPHPTLPTHLLQIWLKPNRRDLSPSYEQKNITPVLNQLSLIASPEALDGAVKIHQNAFVYYGQLEAHQKIEYTNKPNRGIWIQLIAGQLEVNHTDIEAGDGVSIDTPEEITLKAQSPATFLVFDLPLS